MSTVGDVYEVIAIRYGSRVSTRGETFFNYESYGQPDGEIGLDYFFWLLRGAGRAVLVDTGFGPEVGRRRGRTLLVEPVEALARLGVGVQDVTDIVLTHLHYDHTGNLGAFPDASVSLPTKEYEFWTGPYAAKLQYAAHAEQKDIDWVRSAWQEGRVRAVEDGQEILPGVTAHVVGGHTPGQQVTLVKTAGRPVLLASDAIHYYEEMDREMPFWVFSNLAEMYAGYDRLRELREDENAILVAGHDPLVMERFPALEGHVGVAVRLDDAG